MANRVGPPSLVPAPSERCSLPQAGSTAERRYDVVDVAGMAPPIAVHTQVVEHGFRFIWSLRLPDRSRRASALLLSVTPLVRTSRQLAPAMLYSIYPTFPTND